MADELNEITFCDECPYSGEPNGCNRKEGECRAHDYCFDLRDERDALKSENAALRSRLEEAVELPCKVGDKVYCIHGMSNPEMLEWQVNEIRITDHNYMLQLGRAGTKDYRNEASQFYGKWWFTTREAAEARLAELKGEKGCAKT